MTTEEMRRELLGRADVEGPFGLASLHDGVAEAVGRTLRLDDGGRRGARGRG
jgi:hypothetical protein